MIRSLNVLALSMALLLPFAIGGAAGATSIIEGADISSDINAPTPFSLTLGSNLLTANSGGTATGGASNGSDAEFLTVIVPSGLTLDAVEVISRVGSGFQSFIAYADGPVLSGLGPTDIVDGALFNAGSGDLLNGPSGSATDGSLGVESLAAGTYAFWIQETAGPVDYSIDFVVTPEPSTATLFAIGLGALVVRRRESRSN